MHQFFSSSVFVFFLACQLAVVSSCKKDSNSPTAVVLASLTTTTILAVTSTTASSGCIISNDGGGTITARGVVWSTSQNPTVALTTKTVDGNGTGSFTSNLSGLNPGTTYYIRSYATNSAGTAYGNQLIFTTATILLATLTTTTISSISSTTASSGGNISNDGGGAITTRGVVWSTSQNPTIPLTTKTVDGTGTGIFTSNLTGLSPGTVYYVRAYATNSAGTAYGNQQTLTTATSSNPVDVDGNVYTTVTIGTQVWMKENLKVSKYRNGDPITTNLSNSAWNAATTGAYAIYNNDAANNTTYGKLYNWYAVVDSRNLCPVGWHVPSDGEWKTLEISLGMSTTDADLTGARGSVQNVGGKLKSISSLWNNNSATNESGFSGLPGGLRYNGAYDGVGGYCFWWSSTEASGPWYRRLESVSGASARNAYDKRSGLSVRCLMD